MILEVFMLHPVHTSCFSGLSGSEEELKRMLAEFKEKLEDREIKLAEVSCRDNLSQTSQEYSLGRVTLYKKK